MLVLDLAPVAVVESRSILRDWFDCAKLDLLNGFPVLCPNAKVAAAVSALSIDETDPLVYGEIVECDTDGTIVRLMEKREENARLGRVSEVLRNCMIAESLEIEAAALREFRLGTLGAEAEDALLGRLFGHDIEALASMNNRRLGQAA